MTDSARVALALAQVAAGDTELAAATINALPHDRAIAALLHVGAATAGFTSTETGIPAGVLLAAIGDAL